MKKKIRENRGITLMVLIITVIVLLILAGVAMTNLIGENGILSKILTAKQIHESAQQEEKNTLDSYGSILVGSNEDAQVTITLKELREVIKEEIEKTSNIPVGSLISYMGNNVPAGYLLCDGQTYNISEYSALAEQIKNEFGSYNYYGGDGISTFATPNLNGKFLKGSDKAGINEEAGLPNITGALSDVLAQTASEAFRKTGGSYKVNFGTSLNSAATFGALTFNASNSNAIYGRSTTVTPENMSVLYCIKY